MKLEAKQHLGCRTPTRTPAMPHSNKTKLFNKWYMALRAICKFTDWFVRLRKSSWGPYSFQSLTNQSVNLHFAWKAMFYLLYYTKSKSFHLFCCWHFYYNLLSKLIIIYLFSVWNISNPSLNYYYYFQVIQQKKSCSSFIIQFLLIKLNRQKIRTLTFNMTSSSPYKNYGPATVCMQFMDRMRSY
jgi:hypothetical protein